MPGTRFVIAAAVVLLVVAGVLLAGGLPWPRRGAPAPAAVAPPPLPAADAAYYRELAPRLRAATDQARALVALGDARSRNLLAIRAAQRRMDERLDAVDALAAAGTPPARFASAVDSYREGANEVRQAMSEAEAGFLRFDWDRVARATALLDRGAGELERAGARLDAAAGATPVATPT